MVEISQISPLPCFHRTTIPQEYLDVMGHMNIRHYMGIFDDAAWDFFASFGMTQAYYDDTSGGAFALEQHIRYLAEVHVGETVAIYTRIIGRSAKRIHFIHFMINETTSRLAATLEVLGSHVNREIRRTSPFPPGIAAQIDQILAEQSQLGWDAPICGVLKP